ncbi:hypothetical protein ABK040_008969 [Willaertia magna]
MSTKPLQTALTTSSSVVLTTSTDEDVNNNNNNKPSIKEELKHEELNVVEQQENTKSKRKKKKKPDTSKMIYEHLPTELQNQLQSKDFTGNDLHFACDSSLGRMAKHFRMLGIDCFYEPNMTIHYLLFIARRDNRIIITHNRSLIHQINFHQKEKELRKVQQQLNKKKSFNIEEEELKKQKREKELQELEKIYKEQGLEFNREDFEEFEEEEEEDDLNQDNDNNRNEEFIFTRCIVCNCKIEPVEKESIKDEVFPSVFNWYDNFFRCSGCKKVYWGKDSDKEHVNFKSAKEFGRNYTFNGCEDENVTTIHGSGSSNSNSDNEEEEELVNDEKEKRKEF